MQLENELAMVVAFYLSKFGDEGLGQLGFGTYRQAFDEIGRSLQVKPNSVKNWRDEFDPYYDNGRQGWYRRSIRPSRQKVMAAFDGLSEGALRAVVLDILQPVARQQVTAGLQSALVEIKAENKKRPRQDARYVPRGPTGRMAEEFFIAQFYAGLTPFDGQLTDRRDEGVGFDFEIATQPKQIVVEIKGLAQESGGITFTDKEWKTANLIQEDYYLGIVSQILSAPKIGFLQNPARHLTPTYRAFTTIAINWTVNAEQVARAKL